MIFICVYSRPAGAKNLRDPPAQCDQPEPTQMPSLHQRIGLPSTPQASHSWLGKLNSLLALCGSSSKTSSTADLHSKSGVIVKITSPHNSSRGEDNEDFSSGRAGPARQEPAPQYHVTNTDEMREVLERHHYLKATNPDVGVLNQGEVLETLETGPFGSGVLQGPPDSELSPVFEEQLTKTCREVHPKVTASWIELHLGQTVGISENSANDKHSPFETEITQGAEEPRNPEIPYATNHGVQGPSDFIVQMPGANPTMENLGSPGQLRSPTGEDVNPNPPQGGERPNRLNTSPVEEVQVRNPTVENVGTPGVSGIDLEPIPRLFGFPKPQLSSRGKPVVLKRSKKK